MKTTWLALPASAAALDLGVVALGFARARGARAIAWFLVAHALAAAIHAVFLRRALAARGLESSVPIALLGGVLALFVPVVGSLALGAALHVLSVAKPKNEAAPFQRFRPPDALVRRAPTELVPRVLTERLVHLVRHGRSIDTRFRAVLQSNQAPAVVAVPVLKAALGDSAEEVRLSAFTQLERMRRAIDLRIERAREGLRRPDAQPAAAQGLHAALAQDYYELAYLGLVEGEVYRHALHQALVHADEALALAGGDGATLRIVARIRLRQPPSDGSGDEIRTALDAARDAGIPLAELATDYAEEAFRRKAYGEVTEILSATDGIPHDHVLLAKIREFWRWR